MRKVKYIGIPLEDAEELESIRALRKKIRNATFAEKYRLVQEMLRKFQVDRAVSYRRALSLIDSCITASSKIIEAKKRGLEPELPVTVYSRLGFVKFVSDRGTVVVRFEDGKFPKKGAFSPMNVTPVSI